MRFIIFGGMAAVWLGVAVYMNALGEKASEISASKGGEAVQVTEEEAPSTSVEQTLEQAALR